MAVDMSIDELRRILMTRDAIPSHAFEVAQNLCRMTGDGTDPSVLQELVLRALENRDQFGEVEQVINGLVRTLGLFPYLSAGELSLRDLLAYEYHRPINMEEEEVVFHRVQSDVYRLLLDGKNVILRCSNQLWKKPDYRCDDCYGEI